MTPLIPKKTIGQMKSLGLDEATVLNVYRYGQQRRLPSGVVARVRKYSGYEVGIGLDKEKRTGGDVIVFVWKRERR